MRTLNRILVLALLGWCLVGLLSTETPLTQGETVEILSGPYSVDRIYRSMQGPQRTQQVSLLADEPPELVWITGYRAEMVGPDGTTPRSQEFMCHSNLNFDFRRHSRLFGWKKRTSQRLFTLSQGQLSIRFPPGFGIPILSNELLSLNTQVLNLNEPHRRHEVQHKITIEFVRDRHTSQPLQPLFLKAANGLVLLEGQDGYYNVKNPTPQIYGPGCLIGTPAGKGVRKDRYGRQFAGHWVVPPGRQVNHTPATQWLNVPFDTTVHYIAVHLHPFAESLELRDLTTGETIFKSTATSLKQRIGLTQVEAYSSEQGIPIFKDHEYELVSVYQNSSGQEQDAMAVMFLYLFDKEFTRSVLPGVPEDRSL